MARDSVLLITHKRDTFTVDRVAAALESRGARPVRVDSDLFPSSVLLTSMLNGGSDARLRIGDTEVAAGDVRAVWLRKLWTPEIDDEIDPGHRAACERESRAALRGFLDLLRARGARFVNAPDRDDAAESKLRQLHLARAVGLKVPDTCVSNDPAEVRAFFDRCEGRVITKMLTPYSVSMDGSGAFVHTSRVTASDLDDLDGLRYAPMVFQREVEKREELRVAFVAGACFAGSIRAFEDEAAATDWRRADPSRTGWSPGALRSETEAAAARLMSALDLTFGALDFIRTPEGDDVFLEVNPRGEWGMLEKELDLPISSAIADALLADRPLTQSETP